MASNTSTLYEQIGGEAAVNAAVEIFYKKVLADDRIKHWFDGIDMIKQREKQKKFLTLAFGGPKIYTGLEMGAAHKKLVERGLSDVHFDAVAENLTTTLKELNVPQDLIDEVGKIVESQRDIVLCRTNTKNQSEDEHVGWNKWKLKEKKIITTVKPEAAYNTFLIFEKLNSNTDNINLLPGQSIKIRMEDKDSFYYIQNYTPVPSVNGELNLMVKVYPTGRMSKYLGSLKVGDSVEIKGPFGHFIYNHGTAEKINLIAIGSGITPMFQILHAIAEEAKKEDKKVVQVRLIYGNRSEEDIALKNEIEDLIKVDPKSIEVYHALSAPLKTWQGRTGRIDAEYIRSVGWPAGEKVLNLVCGTDQFVATTKKDLIGQGHKEQSIVIF